MAFFQIDFFSDVLGHGCSCNVILPQRAQRQIGMEAVQLDTCPVLYLLHGLSDNYTAWMRNTSIDRYAGEAGFAVVMADTSRYWYTDCDAGKYYTYFSDELPRIMHGFFPQLSNKREETFVAGLSMGGFGAFKLALNNPERYGAAASLSGVMDFDHPIDGEAQMLFENKWKNTENDLQYAAEQLMNSDKPKPRLFQWCGDDDFLIESNLNMKKHMEQIAYPDFTYTQSGGYHAWQFWDEQIRNVIKWLQQSH